MGKVISIVSGKGGVGKTTITANLGIALSDFEKRVLLVDFDLGMSNLDILLGEENRVIYDILDVLEGNCKIIQALIRKEDYPNLYLLPASRNRDFTSLNSTQFEHLMTIFRKEFDFILIDVPTGTSNGFKIATEISDQVILVSSPDPLSVRLSKRVKDSLSSERRKNAMLLINHLRIDLLRENVITNPEQVVEDVGIPLLGIILEDDDILIGAGKGEDVIGIDSVACRAFSNIARRLLGENIPIVLKGKNK